MVTIFGRGRYFARLTSGYVLLDKVLAIDGSGASACRTGAYLCVRTPRTAFGSGGDGKPSAGLGAVLSNERAM